MSHIGKKNRVIEVSTIRYRGMALHEKSEVTSVTALPTDVRRWLCPAEGRFNYFGLRPGFPQKRQFEDQSRGANQGTAHHSEAS